MAGMHNMMIGSATSALISISDDTLFIDDVGEQGLDSSYIEYIVKSDGTISFQGSSTLSGGYSGTTNGTNWVTPTGSASNYEVRATLQSGSNPNTGTMNTWLACTSDRAWTISITGFNDVQSVILIEIRDSATQTVRDSATISMRCRIGS